MTINLTYRIHTLVCLYLYACIINLTKLVTNITLKFQKMQK